jgi:hypothetical protein
MSVARLLALPLAILLLAPLADAYTQPVFYFLKDPPSATDSVPSVPLPVPVPVPVPTLNPMDGILDPYSRQAQNAPNATTAKMRLVAAGAETVVPVRFVTPANASHPDRIKGPLFIGLWTGESATYKANLTATMYEIPAGGAAKAIANASVSLDFNQSKLPDPMALLPQNTTDPMTIAYYELAQVLPAVMYPPALFVLPVDIPFSNGSAFAIGFRLTPGDSGAPLPEGASASIEYDGLYAPSFVYVPWYSADPPRSAGGPGSGYSYSYSSTYSYSASQPTGNEVVYGDEGKKSPGFEPAFAVAALALAAVAVRRRMR